MCFLFCQAPHCSKCALAEEDMMMDSVQTPSPAQPTEELTELGKCLMKHEVSLKRNIQRAAPALIKCSA